MREARADPGPAITGTAMYATVLQACKQAIAKAVGTGQPDETLLVLDGTTGGSFIAFQVTINWEGPPCMDMVSQFCFMLL